MFGIPVSQLVNLVHNVLLIIGGTLVTRGVMNADDLTIVVGATTTLLTSILNVVSHQEAMDETPARPRDDIPVAGS